MRLQTGMLARWRTCVDGRFVKSLLMRTRGGVMNTFIIALKAKRRNKGEN